MCEHKSFSIDELKEDGYEVYFDDLLDGDRFPRMENGCGEGCKQKMKEIYRLMLEDYLKTVTNYYEDARVFKYVLPEEIKEITLGHYRAFFIRQPKIQTQANKDIMIRFKVGILNGEPVRLCEVPEGSECEYSIKSFYDEKNNKLINQKTKYYID